MQAVSPSTLHRCTEFARFKSYTNTVYFTNLPLSRQSANMLKEAIKCMLSIIWSFNQTFIEAHHSQNYINGIEFVGLFIGRPTNTPRNKRTNFGHTDGIQCCSYCTLFYFLLHSSISSEKCWYFPCHSTSAAMCRTLYRLPG